MEKWEKNPTDTKPMLSKISEKWICQAFIRVPLNHPFQEARNPIKVHKTYQMLSAAGKKRSRVQKAKQSKKTTTTKKSSLRSNLAYLITTSLFLQIRNVQRIEHREGESHSILDCNSVCVCVIFKQYWYWAVQFEVKIQILVVCIFILCIH